MDNLKTYEPILVSSGFVPHQDNNTRIKMMIFHDLQGSYVKTEDYLELLEEFEALTKKKKKSTTKDK